jgi:hypothetical protein
MAVAVLLAVSTRLIIRFLAIIAGLAPMYAASAEPALFDAEVRISYGLATGGGSGRASFRDSPLVLAASGSMAIRDQPRTHGYAGIVVETLDRSGIGGEGGLMLMPSERLRLRAGAIAIAEPYTLWGAAVGGGYCAAGTMRVCADVSANMFVGGTDLPDGGVVSQVLFGVAMVFDAR